MAEFLVETLSEGAEFHGLRFRREARSAMTHDVIDGSHILIAAGVRLETASSIFFPQAMQTLLQSHYPQCVSVGLIPLT